MPHRRDYRRSCTMRVYHRWRCPTARSVRCFCINQFEVVHTIDSGYIGRFKIPEGEDADGITIGKFCGIIVLDWRAGDGGIFFINGGVTTPPLH